MEFPQDITNIIKKYKPMSRYDVIMKIRDAFNPGTVLTKKTDDKLQKILKEWDEEIKNQPLLLKDWEDLDDDLKIELHDMVSEYQYRILKLLFCYVLYIIGGGHTPFCGVDLEISSILCSTDFNENFFDQDFYKNLNKYDEEYVDSDFLDNEDEENMTE